MSDAATETLQIFSHRHQQQITAHFEMAKRIERVVLSEDGTFIESVAQLGVQDNEIFLERFNIGSGTNPALSDAVKDVLLRVERDKARAYPKVIANQALVLMCTTLDIYLQSAMKSVLEKDVSAVLALSNPTDITVQEVIRLADNNDAINQVKSKILERFDFAGLKDKLGFLQKCGFNEDRIFSATSAIGYDGVKMRPHEERTYLASIYQMRHDIVHKGAIPISTSEDLVGIKDYLGSFIYRFAVLCKELKEIPSDFDILLDSLRQPKDR